jgi:hypothetical protein
VDRPFTDGKFIDHRSVIVNVPRLEFGNIERDSMESPNPYEPSAAANDLAMRDRPIEHVQLTRKRWTVYFVPIMALVSVVSIPTAIVSGQYRYIASAFGLFVVWIMVRQLTPAEGMETPTIRGTPGMVSLLCWLGFCMALGIGLLYVDSLLFGHSMDAPLETYHIVATLVLVVMMIGGVAVLDRRYRFNKRNRVSGS